MDASFGPTRRITMDTTTINGLHKCKAENTPIEGEVKNMVVLNMPARNGKKAWIKIKSEKPEKGGSPYRILGVDKLDWPPDDYGNIAFNIEVEASSSDPVGGMFRKSIENTQPSVFQQTKATMQQVEKYGSSSNVPIEDQPVMPPVNIPQSTPHAQQGAPMSKDDYWRRKEDRDEERQRFIIRQHSQSMALEVLKLKVTLNELTVEDLTPQKLRQLADYFDNDVFLGTSK